MEVNERKSSTTAKTALGLSIGALGLELLNGRIGNIFGGGVPAAGVALACDAAGHTRCDILEAENAKLKAERYADYVGINTFKEAQGMVEKQNAIDSPKFEKIFDELVNVRVLNARQEEQIKCLDQRLNSKIEMVAKDLSHAIEVESERRMVSDQNIRDWATCNFVQYKRVIDSTQLCPPVAMLDGSASNANSVRVSGTVTTQAATAA